jgi:hypothetical protein
MDDLLASRNTSHMDTLTSGLHKAGESVESGIQEITSGISKGFQGLGSAMHISGGDHDNDPKSAGDSNNEREGTADKDKSKPASTTAQTPAAEQSTDHGLGGTFNTITSGFTSIFTPTADVLTAGAALSRNAANDGVAIGKKIAKSGLDMGSNVVTGTATLSGTALGGVISISSDTSGAVFEPVGSGLKTIEGLDKLGKGVEAINGLSLGAIRQVGQLTTKALHMDGKVWYLYFR